MKELSVYTIARYCSDIGDITTGIDEVWERIRERNRAYKRCPRYFYKRLTKLEEKLKKLTNTNEKKGQEMNYQCREIKRMIDRYENSGNVSELINGLKGHITEYGELYSVAYISKADFEEQGYTANVSNVIIEKIARNIDMSENLYDAIDYWAKHYGIPKKDNQIKE